MLLLLGEMREQAGRAREDRHGLRGHDRKPRSSSTAAIGIATFARQRPPPLLGDGVAQRARDATCGR